MLPDREALFHDAVVVDGYGLKHDACRFGVCEVFIR